MREFFAKSLALLLGGLILYTSATGPFESLIQRSIFLALVILLGLAVYPWGGHPLAARGGGHRHGAGHRGGACLWLRGVEPRVDTGRTALGHPARYAVHGTAAGGDSGALS